MQGGKKIVLRNVSITQAGDVTRTKKNLQKTNKTISDLYVKTSRQIPNRAVASFTNSY
jgi:hypothetical protein